MKRVAILSVILLSANYSYAQYVEWEDLFRIYKAPDAAKENATLDMGFDFDKSYTNSNTQKLCFSYKRVMVGNEGEWDEFISYCQAATVVTYKSENSTQYQRLRKELANRLNYTESESAGLSDGGLKTTFVSGGSKIQFYSARDKAGKANNIIAIVALSNTPTFHQSSVAQNTTPASAPESTDSKEAKEKKIVKPTATYDHGSEKYALVIGVQNYSHIPALRHSLNDATDVSNSLKAKGFKVESLYDPLTKKEIREAIARYYSTMKDKTGAVGLIYYAGHGMQNDGENYIIPATADLKVPGDLDDQCVKMNTLMSVLNSSTNLNILLLDACRTNSLPSFSRDVAQGLSKVEAPQGSIVLFATQPGKVASDGSGRNGLFTSKLLKYINEPGLNIGEVARKVKQEVYVESGNKQLPSLEDNSIGGEFYFTTKDN
ncbi:MAG: caspase domain-containing protein [Cyclobacteriaceae bacterium]